ncbi:MAG: ferritin-like domain-containing protein [Puniceicoccales bacterium]
MTLRNLNDLLIHEVRDLYSAESQLIEALPKMADAATNAELKEAINSHLEETKTHLSRLADVSAKLGVEPFGETCAAMEGLIKEGEEVMHLPADPDVKDAALIAAAQRVEHYEMAGYGSAACFAHCTQNKDVEDLLNETLDEEKEADSKLTKIAKGSLLSTGINQEASTA